MSGKGDTPRPPQIPRKEWEKRWEQTFPKPEKKANT